MPTHPLVVDAVQLVVLLSGDHERRQVGRVDGQENQSKQGPDVRHESAKWDGSLYKRKMTKLE